MGSADLVGFTGPATLFGYHRLQHLSLQFLSSFHLEISNTIATCFNIAVIWLMVFVATRPMDNSQKIINFSAIAKLCLGIGLVIADHFIFNAK